jgi:hypothetical protein
VAMMPALTTITLSIGSLLCRVCGFSPSRVRQAPISMR